MKGRCPSHQVHVLQGTVCAWCADEAFGLKDARIAALKTLLREAGEALHKYGHVLKGVIEAEVVAEVTPEMMNDAELSAAAFFVKLRAAGLLKGGE